MPRPEYEQGVQAALAGATSLTDVSDGLLADLGHIAVASSVDIDLDSGSFSISDEMNSAAEELGVSPLSWMLTGGEDHALAGTFASAADLPDGWTVIGRTTDARGAPTVTVDSRSYSGPAGWTSFQ